MIALRILQMKNIGGILEMLCKERMWYELWVMRYGGEEIMVND